ncbi:hypothetical protein ACIPW9_36240 [Streptomyces sp. NPDC090052]|uniref:hypothetical protein n=1 Tax=Streptomyces sp. NPDC090052 TaxID=3365931 RepID=UPI0038173131
MKAIPDPDTVAYAPSLARDQVLLLQAHHEAAHAVIAVHYGLEVTSLEILQRTEDHGGWSIGGITYVTYFPHEAHQFALQGAAGELAALTWLDKQILTSEETIAAATADHDRDDVIQLLAQDGIQISWPQVRDRAQTEVDALWPQVSAVAQAAAEKGRLTGAEIVRICAVTSPA